MPGIDLALSGSGVRLGSHVGGLVALEELGYKPERIVATSGGAIVGGMYAAGIPAGLMEKIFMKLNLAKLRSFAPWAFFTKRGIFSYKKLHKFLLVVTKGKKLKDLDIEYMTVAYDTKSKKEILLNREDYPDLTVADAAVASACIPYYFGSIKIKNPKTKKNMRLIDGGIINNYPIAVLKSERPLMGFWVQGQSKAPKSRWWDMFAYDKSVVSAMLDTTSHKHIKTNYWEKTIPMIIKGISAIKFDLTKDEKIQLLQIGYNAVVEKLK